MNSEAPDSAIGNGSRRFGTAGRAAATNLGVLRICSRARQEICMPMLNSNPSQSIAVRVVGLALAIMFAPSTSHAQRGQYRTSHHFSQPELVVTTNQNAWGLQASAESAMESERYQQAASMVAQAITQDPDNGMLHLFAAHAFFAIGDFEKAAAELGAATELMPNVDWHRTYHQISWIDNRKNYSSQINRLVAFIAENPTSIDAQVVFAFHAAVRGKPDLAKKHLDWILGTEKKHDLAGRLIHLLAGRTNVPVRVNSQSLGRRKPHATGFVNGTGARLGR